MLLSVFALNYATTSRLGAERSMTNERLITESHVLRSALTKAEHGLLKYLANQELLLQIAESAPEEQAHEAQEHLFHPRHEPYELVVDGVEVEVRVVSEAGKWNVNSIDLHMLEKVLTACGLEYGTQTTRVANSILDWIDEDDLRRIEGAETPYYMALEHPYPAKNGPLESIEELLLIRGVDRPLFQGTDETPGLIDFLTVSGQGPTLDINSASPRSLALVPDIRQETIDSIVAQRSTKPIKNMPDIAPHVEYRDYQQLTQYFDVLPISRVTLEARVVDFVSGLPGRSLRSELDL
ncbi:general secretion pathway protein GspK [Desulfonatronum sp. SC1]|uniref:general secretion pathway protein GspK n=1 Tax=Desulfonatronum sp. SC1 TaxID=2109626 RepID=UPI001E35EA2C|nr:type II secretion system protein GspK [Desulfonatronum sp. SC1]